MSDSSRRRAVKGCGGVFCAMALAGAVALLRASAEELVLPLGSDAPSMRELPRPTRGMSRDTVLSRFGEPISMAAPVGEPPISRWEYGRFVVVFEHDTVLHSVVRRDAD